MQTLLVSCTWRKKVVHLKYPPFAEYVVMTPLSSHVYVYISEDTPRRVMSKRTLSNPRKKKGVSMMVAAGLCISFDGECQVKIDALRYHEMLHTNYDPWANTFRGRGAAFQEDGPPCHTARSTCALRGELFRETLVWPALSHWIGPHRQRLWGVRVRAVSVD